MAMTTRKKDAAYRSFQHSARKAGVRGSQTGYQVCRRSLSIATPKGRGGTDRPPRETFSRLDIADTERCQTQFILSHDEVLATQNT